MKYEWGTIDELRSKGCTWSEVAAVMDLDVVDSTLRSANSRRPKILPPAAAPERQGMKILGIDIETAPNTAHVWGLFKQTIGLNQILQTGRVMCFAARWFGGASGEQDTVFRSEHGEGHKNMIRHAHSLLDEADAVVHYNGARFDMPTLNREFLKYGMNPPSPYAQIDLLQSARKQFRFASNRLDHLLKELHIGEKVRHDGHTLWIRCMNGDDEAWERMEEYNRGDVDQLEALYHKMRPWITNHPNHALYEDTERPVCPNCGSENLQSRGTAKTRTQQYRRYQCRGCGTWTRERYNSTPKDKKNHILTQAVN